jgi:hypothetical protein
MLIMTNEKEWNIAKKKGGISDFMLQYRYRLAKRGKT